MELPLAVVLLLSTVACAQTAALRAPVAQDRPASSWALDEFMIYAGWPSGVQAPDDEALLKTLADAGFTSVMWDSGKLEMCRRLGLKVVVTDITPELAPTVSGHPALWGYHILDEPRLAQFDSMATLVEAFRRADPTHPGYVNMYSWGSDFLRVYMEKVRPMLLSYDWYQWWWGTEMHYSRLEQYREAALLAGVPLICWQEVNSNPYVEWGGPDRSCPADNLDRLRLSVYTSLAYGVKGIEWFTSSLMFDRGTANLNACGRDVAVINAELRKLGPELVGLRSVNVYHTAPLPRGTREAPPDHWFQLTGEEGGSGLLFGTFVDSTETDYVFVVNRDYRQSQQADVVIQKKWRDVPKVDSVERFDLDTGSWVAFRGRSWFSFHIPPAQGVLLRIRRSPEAEPAR